MEKIWIGTSGWSYTSWAGTFYPPKCSSANWLDFYTSQFPTVEINATFYRLPSETMVEGWNNRVPEEFLFAVKGSRYLTHMKKLVHVADGLKQFFDRIAPLRKHIGPVLWQLPPSLQKDAKRLDAFLASVPKGLHHAVEFRHPSWLDDGVYDVLRKHNAACVWISSLLMPRHFTETADFVYVRFHGLEGGAAHNYSKAELEPWAEHLSSVSQEGRRAFAYFNNDVTARAPANAKTLAEMLGWRSVHPFREASAEARR